MSDSIQNDPFADREASNYDNPIPSREFIIEFLERTNVPMNRNDIFEALELKGEDQYEGLRRRLRAMERDGQLVFTRRQCYALPEKLEIVKGYVIGHKDGYGWVRPEGTSGKDEDILLPYHQMRTLIHGDYVLVQPSGTDKKGQKRGASGQDSRTAYRPDCGAFFL